MIRRLSTLFGLALSVLAGTAAHTQSGTLTTKIGYAGVIDCDQPKQVKDFPFSGEGTMKLSQDRSASLDMEMKGLTRSELKIDTKLGNRPTPGGTALLRVISASQLQAIWNLPNNAIIVTMRASPTACTMNVQFRLRSGARQYSIYDQNGFYFCSRPRMTSLTCVIK
jgi:hypothetical protein